MRIFYAFLIIVTALILFMLPYTEAQYDYVTDLRTDTNTVTTGVGETTGNITLFTALYDNDTSTITITSNDSNDTPLFSSYSNTTRQLVFSGLSANLTRTITVTYDVYALSSSGAIDAFVGQLDRIWLLIIVVFPVAAIAGIFISRQH